MNRYNKFMIFIDGSNVFYGCGDFEFEISYVAFLSLLKKDKNIIRVNLSKCFHI